MKVGYLITARLKSTRLPRKLLREIKGKPVLGHMLDRLKLATKVDEIVVCTSPSAEDRPLVELAAANGVGSYCGDLDDVILRLLDAAREFGLDYVLNITADCPLVDPVYADKIVDAYGETGADLIRSFGLPHGAFSYGMRPEALAKVVEIKASKETEVWGRYFTDTDLFHVYDLPIENPLHRKPQLRMTLDYPEDLAFFEAIFDALYHEGEVFSLDEVLALLEQRPEIVDINRHCHKSFQRRWTRQSEIHLKPRYEVAKAAIVGCGSIGQRHIRNLQKLGIHDLVTVRSREGHFRELSAELEVRELASWDELGVEKPDVAVIGNPTSLHLETIDRFLPHVRGIFVEKPLSGDLEGVAALLERVEASRKVLFVGYNMEFHPAVVKVRELLASGELGDPLVLQCQVGHWLPDWHPYEDYRTAYYARADLGGGVTRTLSHEIHMALQLLGPAVAVSALMPAHESLPLAVDVVSDLMVRHVTGAVSQIHLDYLQRPYHREGVISCVRGWIRYDLAAPRVTVQRASEKSPCVVWESSHCDGNQSYLDEMGTFVRYVREGRVRHAYDALQGTHSQAVIQAAMGSAAKRRECELPQWVRELK